MNLQKFTFNPFQENTYLIWDDEKNGAIIDPGCYTPQEEQQIKLFISEHQIDLKRNLNTHAHLDHIFGNRFIYDEYGLKPELHKEDEQLLEIAERSADMYGIPGYKKSPEPEQFLREGEAVAVGKLTFEVIFGPGHAPGHVAFYNKASQKIFSGDILFQGSFGRTDLPWGDFQTLKNSIVENMFVLPEDTVVYSGHGPETMIGVEKSSNPILYMNA